MNKKQLLDNISKLIYQFDCSDELYGLINCDKDPFIPNNWHILEHKKGGILKFDPTKISLHLSEKQKNNDNVFGYDIKHELNNKKNLNANVLDYLLIHQELIPDYWKGKAIFFWGTIYINSIKKECVRYILWEDEVNSWYSSSYGVNFDIFSNDCFNAIIVENSNVIILEENEYNRLKNLNK